MSITDLIAAFLYQLFFKILEIVVALSPAYSVKEITDHRCTVRGALYLGVELNTVKALRCILYRRIRAIYRLCDREESVRQLYYLIGMTHKSYLL